MPNEPGTEYLALGEADLEMIIISFPGDEQHMGGCLAAGRGFFHIGPDGSAEPCPFSPFSDSNVLSLGVKGALSSPLFRKLRKALEERGITVSKAEFTCKGSMGPVHSGHPDGKDIEAFRQFVRSLL